MPFGYEYRDERGLGNLEYDHSPPHHHSLAGEVATAAFVVGAATRPRAMAKILFFAGLVFLVIGLFNAKDGYYLASCVAVMIMCWVLALIVRAIGWTAGLALDTAQDVIHDRYDRHQDQTDYKFDPYTGQPLNRFHQSMPPLKIADNIADLYDERGFRKD